MGVDDVGDPAGFASEEPLEIEGVDAALIGSAAYDVDELVHEAVGLPVGCASEA